MSILHFDTDLKYVTMKTIAVSYFRSLIIIADKLPARETDISAKLHSLNIISYVNSLTLLSSNFFFYIHHTILITNNSIIDLF